MITPDLPVIEGALSAFIDGSAVAELQELLERCTDFEVLVTGHPPEPYAARELLVDVPPDRPKAIGISVPGMPDGSPGMERSDGKRAG